MNLVRSQTVQKTANFAYNLFKLNRLTPSFRPYAKTTSNKKSQEVLDEIDDDRPVKFSTSLARRWKASQSREGHSNVRLWYEPYVIVGSLAVFLSYFCIFREENDIDQELSRSLYSRIEGLEEQQLRISLEYNLDHNLPIDDINKRLSEIEQSKVK